VGRGLGDRRARDRRDDLADPRDLTRAALGDASRQSLLEGPRSIPSLPFGGIGDSRFGRIHGDEGVREFTRVKSTAEQVMAIPLDWFRRLRGYG
jgi:hypothetical protein